MTALAKYQRLESPGLWRDAPDAQRREVIVAFRDATLVLTDPRTERPVTHWSLPALIRQNPGLLPALYAPGPDADETLEIDDADMIGALETVLGVVRRKTPRPGRLRGTLLGAATLAILAVGVVFVPDALLRHTAGMLPFVTRAAIGQAALADVIRLTGKPCTSPLGDRALSLLSERLFGGAGTTLLVMRQGVNGAVHLPGNIVLLGRDTLQAPLPEAPAGYALAEATAAATADPMLPILGHAGLSATVRLLTTGALPDTALAGYGEVLLKSPPVPLPAEALLAAFQKAAVSSAPYAYALDPSGESTLSLIEADPYRGGSPRALLNAADWDSLRAICDAT
ncbi:hypothetical protein [Paragemmobacter straminiformis]|uniref:Uncharacterized protein n=1 Tax=Paragemmobacter straminiformis TaxID=2045119 RepID=A0A842I3V0_9RHOB|nr:hypothetical protein [Gemmobacter straminiformis]MBC2834113.1 hypothetical protein [Gemmobacter straminiformis]